MRKLPYDYFRCTNAQCPLKEQCCRWLQNETNLGPRTPFMHQEPGPDGVCSELIPTERESDDLKE